MYYVYEQRNQNDPLAEIGSGKTLELAKNAADNRMKAVVPPYAVLVKDRFDRVVYLDTSAPCSERAAGGGRRAAGGGRREESAPVLKFGE
jgi:hypothetical protein